jgi:acyl dehydratase
MRALVHYSDIKALKRYVGGPWYQNQRTSKQIDKLMISRFADVTNNHQWIHKPHKDEPGDPYNGQIAHGLLLLSLMPSLVDDEQFEIVGHNLRVIRGFEKVRFTNPVYPGETVYCNSRVIKVYAAKSGKGTVVERDIQLWVDNPLSSKLVLCCTFKLQYF